MGAAFSTLYPCCLILGMLIAGVSICQPQRHSASRPGEAFSPQKPQQISPAPFSLPDLAGKRRSLAEFRGRPVFLFFLCGCEPCHHFGRAWAQVQQSQVLSPPKDRPASKQGHPPLSSPSQRRRSGQGNRPQPPLSVPALSSAPPTLVVFLGDASTARTFVETVGLDKAQTVVLPDPNLEIASLYKVVLCPHVFMMDAKGLPRFESHRTDNASSEISPMQLTARLISLWQNNREPSPRTGQPSALRKGRLPVPPKNRQN